MIEVKEIKDSPPWIFSYPYPEILRLVDNEKSQSTIAKELGKSLQNLNYYIHRLKKIEILVAGVKTSYAPLRINPDLDPRLKEKILSYTEKNSEKFHQSCNMHLILFDFPVIENRGLKLRYPTKLRGYQTCQNDVLDGCFFRLFLGPKKLRVQFSPLTHIFIDSPLVPRDLPKIGKKVASVIIDDLLSIYKKELTLGKGRVRASYAFPDPLAKLSVKMGVRISITKAGVRTEIDGSKGHFKDIGEVEFTGYEESVEERLKNYLNFWESIASINTQNSAFLEKKNNSDL